MTQAPYGYCWRCQTNVATRSDLNIGIIVLCCLLIFFFGLGLLLLVIYLVYKLAIADKVCDICGSAVWPVPMPVYPMPAYMPYPPGQYYHPPRPAYQEGGKYCAFCAQPLPMSARFCSRCGQNAR